jgi:hypothetical protein
MDRDELYRLMKQDNNIQDTSLELGESIVNKYMTPAKCKRVLLGLNNKQMYTLARTSFKIDMDPYIDKNENIVKITYKNNYFKHNDDTRIQNVSQFEKLFSGVDDTGKSRIKKFNAVNNKTFYYVYNIELFGDIKKNTRWIKQHEIVIDDICEIQDGDAQNGIFFDPIESPDLTKEYLSTQNIFFVNYEKIFDIERKYNEYDEERKLVAMGGTIDHAYVERSKITLYEMDLIKNKWKLRPFTEFINSVDEKKFRSTLSTKINKLGVSQIKTLNPKKYFVNDVIKMDYDDFLKSTLKRANREWQMNFFINNLSKIVKSRISFKITKLSFSWNTLNNELSYDIEILIESLKKTTETIECHINKEHLKSRPGVIGNIGYIDIIDMLNTWRFQDLSFMKGFKGNPTSNVIDTKKGSLAIFSEKNLFNENTFSDGLFELKLNGVNLLNKNKGSENIYNLASGDGWRIESPGIDFSRYEYDTNKFYNMKLKQINGRSTMLDINIDYTPKLTHEIWIPEYFTAFTNYENDVCIHYKEENKFVDYINGFVDYDINNAKFRVIPQQNAYPMLISCKNYTLMWSYYNLTKETHDLPYNIETGVVKWMRLDQDPFDFEYLKKQVEDYYKMCDLFTKNFDGMKTFDYPLYLMIIDTKKHIDNSTSNDETDDIMQLMSDLSTKIRDKIKTHIVDVRSGLSVYMMRRTIHLIFDKFTKPSRYKSGLLHAIKKIMSYIMKFYFSTLHQSEMIEPYGFTDTNINSENSQSKNGLTYVLMYYGRKKHPKPIKYIIEHKYEHIVDTPKNRIVKFNIDPSASFIDFSKYNTNTNTSTITNFVFRTVDPNQYTCILNDTNIFKSKKPIDDDELYLFLKNLCEHVKPEHDGVESDVDDPIGITMSDDTVNTFVFDDNIDSIYNYNDSHVDKNTFINMTLTEKKKYDEDLLKFKTTKTKAPRTSNFLVDKHAIPLEYHYSLPTLDSNDMKNLNIDMEIKKVDMTSTRKNVISLTLFSNNIFDPDNSLTYITNYRKIVEETISVAICTQDLNLGNKKHKWIYRKLNSANSTIVHKNDNDDSLPTTGLVVVNTIKNFMDYCKIINGKCELKMDITKTGSTIKMILKNNTIGNPSTDIDISNITSPIWIICFHKVDLDFSNSTQNIFFSFKYIENSTFNKINLIK